MSRRKRTDSAAGLQQIVSDAALPAEQPPAYIFLTDSERQAWVDLYQSKARRAWRKQDLLMLADACRVRDQIETMRRKLSCLDALEDLMAYEKITKLIDLSVKQYRLLCVYLQIHPDATQGKARRQVDQNQTHAAAASYADGGDGLIARPKTH